MKHVYDDIDLLQLQESKWLADTKKDEIKNFLAHFERV